MEVASSRQIRPYPRYMYHKDENEPKVVMSRAEETELSTKGWITTYIHKEYPKMVGDKIVKSPEEEEQLLASQVELIEEAPPRVPPFDATVDINSPDNVPSEDLFTEGEEPPVVKETQVDGQDTAVIKEPKKGNGRRKK